MAQGIKGQLARARKFLLDKFSQADIRTWKKLSDDEEKFHVQLFHHLEALRQIHRDELIEALSGSKAISASGSGWTRIIDYKYSNEPLSPKGSIIRGGRFNIGADLEPGKFPPFPVLYIAEDYLTAYLEKFGATDSSSSTKLAGHEFALRNQSSFSSLRLSLNLTNVFDLTKASSLREFAKIIATFEIPNDLKELGRSVGKTPPWLITKPGELKNKLLDSVWRFYPVQFGIPANPQIFGRMLRDAGFEGVLYPSVKGMGKNLGVFVENLQDDDSFIALADTAPSSVSFSRMDSSNWKKISKE